MCCSIRAAVFFLASVHIFFSVTQLVYILPVAVGEFGQKVAQSVMAFIYCVLFFATGFMTFRGADEESATLVRVGAFCLALVIILRFILLSLSLMLVDKIPEASFLYVYGTSVIPVMFTVILYLVYLAILFCYYKELKYENSSLSSSSVASGIGRTRGRHIRTRGISSTSVPISIQSPPLCLRPHVISNNVCMSRTYSGTIFPTP